MAQSKYGVQVGSTTSVSPEDSNMCAHNIENPEVLKKVNAFVGAIAEQEYINPDCFALEQLGNKLKTIGLELGNVDMKGVTVKLVLKYHNSAEDLVKT